MNNNKINSLYELIKQKNKEKGRKLKIICDWDECILPTRARAIFNMSKEGEIKLPFPEFFEKFWENVEIETPESGSQKIIGYKGTEQEKKIVEEFEKKKRRKLEEASGFFFDSRKERFEAPFLSIAEQLLRTLKEDLISELIIVSSGRERKDGHLSFGIKGKKEKFKKTFGHFFQAKCELYIKKRPDYKPSRWNWTKKNYPDFDIFIDDNPNIVSRTRKLFLDESEKSYVLPDYKFSRHVQAPNIYHVKTTVSNIEDRDFALASLEKKLEILEKKIKQEVSTKNKNYFWLIPSLGVIFFGFSLVLLFLLRKTRK